MNNINHFCLNVRRIRRAKDITQQQLAQSVGVKQETITKMEGGQKFPSLPKIYRVAEALGVDVTELFKVVAE